ncbi:NAD-dependent epimerase/dehydratase family protein [Sandaracinus amylolyticus]|uniref:NAD-dependent epimerase/dehydratase family protein n=1 Tax=Sandaracinus amylolyticus TaxID=927083 RepID=UPI001F031F5B|nr:NAD-dependent epimerase/dehydratase family protein [Sandaracinus amylolyticus]UJR80145.1 Nucleoside-diphosphate-sugar epimerase [Sandaracinus amylolyticus]
MSEPVLVTGAGGFVGSGIVRALVARGVFVHAIQRGRYDALEALEREGKLRIVRGDLGDRDAVLRAAEGTRGVFHVAAKAGVWGSYADYYRSNVVGTENVLHACRAHAIPKLVFTSTPSVVHAGDDVEGVDERAPYAERYETAYPETKAVAEKMVLAENAVAGLSTVALRPHLVWGPGDPHLVPRILERARRGRLVLVGGGHKRIDATYVDSAVHAHLCAWDRLAPGAACAGRAYFVAQGEPMPLRELILGILDAAGLPPVTRSIDPRVAYAAGALLEGTYRALRLRGEPPLTRFVAHQLATAHWFDLSAAKRDLGYEAPISTAEGLRRLRASLHAP